MSVKLHIEKCSQGKSIKCDTPIARFTELHSIHTLVCLTNTKQPNNYLSLKSCTHKMTWNIWKFQYLLYLNVNGLEQRFSYGCQEQMWNNGDVGWMVTNSGSAMGIRNRRETLVMLDGRSQTVVQHCVSERGMKQWWCWMNGHKQWFSIAYREEAWNNGNVGWTVTNTVNLGYNIPSGVPCKDCLYLRIIQITF
jgi:hypothetical protein